MLIDTYHKVIDSVGSRITTIGFLGNYKPKKGDIIIDVGAYFGLFTVSIAKKIGEGGRVIAFEPNPKNYKILKKHLGSLNLNNVIAINKALFNKNIDLNLSMNFSKSGITKRKREIKIKNTTLDKEIAKLGIHKVDLIKMDVEGAELEVIEGAKKTLRNTKNLAIACYHKRNGKMTGEILQPILKKIGFNTKIGFFLHPTLYGRRNKI